MNPDRYRTTAARQRCFVIVVMHLCCVIPAVALTVASKAGAHLDSNLQTGGGTDDTRALQEVLDQAAQGRPVRLLIDGPALVSGLDVYGNTTIECTAGGGVYLKDNSSRAIIRNAHRSRAAVTDENIEVRGCVLNGNREHQPGVGFWGNQERDRTSIAGLEFFGVKHLVIEDMTLWKVRAYGVWIANSQYINVRNLQVDDGSPHDLEKVDAGQQAKLLAQYTNTDGLHFNGPIRYVTIDGLSLHTGDDALAFNANDGDHDDMTINNDNGPFVGQGPISDVDVSNVMLDDALQGIRFLSSSQRIDRIVISNVTGTVRWRMAVLGHWVIPEHTGNYGSVILSNINVNARAVPCWDAVLSTWHLSEQEKQQTKHTIVEEWECPLFSLNSHIESLMVHHVTTHVVDGRPLIFVGPDAVVQDMTADLSAVDSSLQSVPLQLEARGRIERLNFSLDWRGLSLGKNPILDHSGVVNQLHWVHSRPRL